MDAPMTTQRSGALMSDISVGESRTALILRDAALPDAPMAMPQQVIEMAHIAVTETKLRRFLAGVTQSFGPAARGR